MASKGLRKLFSVLVAVAMATSVCLPTAAFATEQVQVEDHTWSTEQARPVSELTIGDVDAPELGSPLDDCAVVSTAEGESWEIPVLWIGSDLQLATEPVEGTAYLPALAFFMPADYAIQGVDESGKYAVKLSDELTKLFGGNEIISVYDASTGITYILPASLRDFFSRAPGVPAWQQGGTAQDEGLPAVESLESQPEDQPEECMSLVDIYCAQTARDAMTDEDLEYLLDLILNKLQPQAVELLLDSFPAFRAAADNGQIGTRIGLYVYFRAGDHDGDQLHETAEPDALAYVFGDAVKFNDGIRYGYAIGIDVSSLAKRDANEDFVTNPKTGKYILVRSGEGMTTFENTIVHELFHAMMDDYNRTGMVGGTNIEDVYTGGSDKFPTKELEQRYMATYYPKWFREGTASAVENVYAFRYDTFQLFRATSDGKGLEGSFTTANVLRNYISGATEDGKPFYLDLVNSVKRVNPDGTSNEVVRARYATGYLAALYLSELSARSLGSSSVSGAGDSLTISSTSLRMGLNRILERMHNGETLDAVIKDISPVVDGKKLYTSTDDFEAKFIKGPVTKVDGADVALGDKAPEGSLEFVTKLLNYLQGINTAVGRTNKTNGSILMDFDADVASPLDPAKTSTSDYLKIIESNTVVESSVPDSEALKGGGKSRSGSPSTDSSTGAGSSLGAGSLPMAAKAVSEQLGADGVDADALGTVADEAGNAEADGVAEPTEEPLAESVDEPAGQPENKPAGASDAEQPAAVMPAEDEGEGDN